MSDEKDLLESAIVHEVSDNSGPSFFVKAGQWLVKEYALDTWCESRAVLQWTNAAHSSANAQPESQTYCGTVAEAELFLGLCEVVADIFDSQCEP